MFLNLKTFSYNSMDNTECIRAALLSGSYSNSGVWEGGLLVVIYHKSIPPA